MDFTFYFGSLTNCKQNGSRPSQFFIRWFNLIFESDSSLKFAQDNPDVDFV